LPRQEGGQLHEARALLGVAVLPTTQHGQDVVRSSFGSGHDPPPNWVRYWFQCASGVTWIAIVRPGTSRCPPDGSGARAPAPAPTSGPPQGHLRRVRGVRLRWPRREDCPAARSPGPGLRTSVFLISRTGTRPAGDTGRNHVAVGTRHRGGDRVPAGRAAARVGRAADEARRAARPPGRPPGRAGAHRARPRPADQGGHRGHASRRRAPRPVRMTLADRAGADRLDPDRAVTDGTRGSVGDRWHDEHVRRSTTIPLVSRQEQVTSLLLAVGRASAGRPGLTLVGGDAGVGKTRLISHVTQAARQAGAHVVVVHCVDLGQVGIPYLPFTDALTQLQAGAAGEDAAARVAELVRERPALWRLLEPGGGAETDHDERLQLFEGIARSLADTGTAGAPLVLVVEDAHWADASTRDVLRFLAARARAEHVLLVVTYRADDVDRRHPLRPLLAELSRLEHVERIDLRPFDETELREFTTALAGAPLAPAAFSEVMDRSEGNAFFAEELLDAGPDSASLPWTLTEVLRTRLERLDPEVQQVLRIASVAGRRVREDLLRAAAARAGTPDVDAALREAVTQQVLVVSGTHLEVRHALLAEALYADLLPGERSAVHRAYLAVIEQEGPDGMPIG